MDELGKSGSVQEVIQYIKRGISKSPFMYRNDIQKVCVIVDADENPKKRFREIIEAFDQTKFAVPSQPGLMGKKYGKKSVAVYLFPDNNAPGSLETLFYQLFKEKYKEKVACINKYFSCLEEKTQDMDMTENNRAKTAIRIFNATPNTDRVVDTIIKNIDYFSSLFNAFDIFLRELIL